MGYFYRTKMKAIISENLFVFNTFKQENVNS